MAAVVRLVGPMLALVLIGVSSASGALAAPDTGQSGGTTLLDAVTQTALNTLGDNSFSTTDLTTVFSDPTQHYGPYPSSSPDSGTCGNNWAIDTYDRHFTVRLTSGGTYQVYEQFKNGSFLTGPAPTQPSPGGCDTDPGGALNAGVTGDLHGYFVVTFPPGELETSTSPYCDAVAMTNSGCTTTTFINTHFTPACYPVTCTVTTYFFNYAAGNQSLGFGQWKNASCNRGGNQGDIATTLGPAGLQKSPLCP